MNQLILGDCHEVLKRMESESVDLIHLDNKLVYHLYELTEDEIKGVEGNN